MFGGEGGEEELWEEEGAAGLVFGHSFEDFEILRFCLMEERGRREEREGER